MNKTNQPASAAKERSFSTAKQKFDREELYRLLVEGVSDYAIFMLDKTGHIISWNPGAEHIKGYKEEEIIGKHFSVFYPHEAIESNYPQFELQQALEHGKFEDEGWRVIKDGTLIWANVVITALYSKQGEHVGFSKVTRDLSEKRKNEELVNKNKELLRINTDLDNFIYTASHDLKAPVINLEGLVEVLQEELEEGRHEDIMSRITSSINRLKNVIDDLTQVARLQDTSTAPGPVLFRELFAEIEEELQPFITRTGTQITTDLGDYTIAKYPRKNLRSILYNLLSNALKYSSPERTPQIDVKLEKPSEDLLVLSFSDNGLGMTTAQKSKIFSMYKRMHTHVEGSGLGLYIVKRILENNDDRIEVESKEGEGSVFRVYFKV